MRGVIAIILWMAAGCAAPVAGSSNTSTAPAGPAAHPLPAVWGLAPVEDMDPDPDVVEVHLTASRTQATFIDNGPTRVWAYNDTVPGPLLQLWKGQALRVVFTNDLREATTIHWHGLRIPDEMDGVPAVQEPVAPGETFIYEFTPPDAGSYWYHPHTRSRVQVERGLYGALVVHEEAPPAYDRERYFVLDDVRLDADGGLSDLATLSHMDGMHGRHGNVLLANGSSEVLRDDVLRDHRERWRIVNTANARLMWVDVTGGDWRVVAVDGTLLPEPIVGDAPVLLPVGRRLDLEVVPGARPEAVRLRIVLPDGRGADTPYVMFEGTLVGDEMAPGFLDWSVPALPAPRTVTQELGLSLDGQGSMMSLNWLINGATYDDSTPIAARGRTPTRIVIREQSGLPHPFHLHGQFFQVVTRDGLPRLPGLMDTVLVDGDETVELYTELDNPGAWMAHCHILEHAELGMMTEVHVSE